MRADAHYVDQLDAPAAPRTATRPAAAAARASQLSALNAVDHEIANALAAVLSSTSLLGDDTPRLTRKVTVEMIRAEVQRAACTLRMASVLRHGVPEHRRLVAVKDVVQRAADGLAADARLRGIHVSTENTSNGALLNVDPELLASALSAVALTLCAALNHVDEAGLRLTAGPESNGRITLTIEQDFVVLPETWLTVPTAAAALDAASGQQIVPLLALCQVVDAYAGKLVTSRLPHGSRVEVDLPTVPRR
jgi:signal transduction histidine kinase